MTVKETTVACATLLFAAAALTAPCHAQGNPANDDEARIADIVTASHVLANEVFWTASAMSARACSKSRAFFHAARDGARARHPCGHRRGRPRLQAHHPQRAPAERERYIHCRSIGQG